MKEVAMDNCIRVRCFSPFHYRFIFLDTPEYVSANIFASIGLRLWNIKEMKKEGSRFHLIICNIRKRDLGRFHAALEQLKNNILLLGYRDYEDACVMLKNAEQTIMKTKYGSL